MTTPSATIRERGTYRTLLPAEDWVTRAIPGGALLLAATVLSLLVVLRDWRRGPYWQILRQSQ